MRKSSHNLLLAAVFLATFSAVLLVWWLSTTPRASEDQLPITFTVDNVIGIGETTERDLFMGGIPPGAKGKRSITLSNGGKRMRQVALVVEGDFAPWVNLSANNFPLAPGANRTVLVTIAVPEDAELRNYTGMFRMRYE